eukprot:PhM_4_TR7026/c0_g1_i1/m.43155
MPVTILSPERNLGPVKRKPQATDSSPPPPTRKGPVAAPLRPPLPVKPKPPIRATKRPAVPSSPTPTSGEVSPTRSPRTADESPKTFVASAFLLHQTDRVMREAYGADEKTLVLHSLQNLQRGTALVDVYISECHSVGPEVIKKPNSGVVRTLTSNWDATTVVDLSFHSNLIGTVRPLLPVFVMCQHLTSLTLKNNGLSNDDCADIYVAFRHHASIVSIDLSRNPDITGEGGRSLLLLVRSNRRLGVMRLASTSIPATMLTKISKQAAMNLHDNHITREQYLQLRSVFERMDRDGSGTVDLKELVEAEMDERRRLRTRVLQRLGTRDQFQEYCGLIREQQHRYEAKCREVFRKISKDPNDRGITFAEYVKLQYPQCPMHVIEGDLAIYRKDSSKDASSLHPTGSVDLLAPVHDESFLTLDQIINLFARYDKDESGSVNVVELMQGVGVEERIARMLLADFDFNRDEALSIEEFIAYCSLADLRRERTFLASSGDH